MEHQMLIRTFLVEVAAGGAALTLLVVAVVCCRRRAEPFRWLAAVVCLAGCVAAGLVSLHSHDRLAGERAKKCNPNVQRALCG